eukprot:469740_1
MIVMVMKNKKKNKKKEWLGNQMSVKEDRENNDSDGDEKQEEKQEERMAWEPDVSKRGPRELSRDYDERKEQLSESFDAYDDEGEGFISNDRCRQYIRDLFDVS